MITRSSAPKVKPGKAEAFIRGKAALNGRAKRHFTRVITNFEHSLLERVDAAAAGSGLNRSAFIVSAVAERLRQLDRDV